jgi:hypothetical protein
MLARRSLRKRVAREICESDVAKDGLPVLLNGLGGNVRGRRVSARVECPPG